MMARALVLFSGGLDSLLAARLLADLCDGVTAICFTSPFFGSADARAAAGGLGIELVEQDMTEVLTAYPAGTPARLREEHEPLHRLPHRHDLPGLRAPSGTGGGLPRHR